MNFILAMVLTKQRRILLSSLFSSKKNVIVIGCAFCEQFLVCVCIPLVISTGIKDSPFSLQVLNVQTVK